MKVMEANITDQDFFNAERPLAEPHFDEEATLLSARRVVPLARPSGTKRRIIFTRPWFLALALASAMLLGIFATAAYYSRPNRLVPAPLPNSEIVGAGVQGEASKSTTANAPSLGLSGPPLEAQSPLEARQSENPAVSFDKNFARIKTNRQQRAARRDATKRPAESARRATRSSDDLLRIRDIFEGPHKP